MNENVTDTKTRPGFKRCAVGKIDLKGRFVYIDDEIEQLLGYTKEELFGCHLVDFLDEASAELIESLLSHRNHYESFYDATTLTLISKQGLPVSARAIVTLNFIAGNPVNYQLIMEAAGNSSAVDSPGAEHLPVEEFIDALHEGGPEMEASSLLPLIREFAGAVQGSLYLIEGDQLEPRAGSSADGSIEFAFRDIPEPNDLHRFIAAKGGEYAFTDGGSIQDGVDISGAAPNEYITLLPRADGQPQLLRLIFATDLADAAAQAAVDRARLAVKLWRHEVAAGKTHAGNADPGLDIKFTVGFLDQLGVGAALIDASGTVIGYNRVLTELVATEEPGDDYHRLADTITAGSPHEVRRALEAYFTSRTQGAESDDCRLEISLADQSVAEVALVALSDQAGDLSTCLVVLPQGQPASPNAVGDNQFWLSVLGALKAPSTMVVEHLSALAHELFNRVGTKANDRLKAIADSARIIGGIVEEAADLVRAGSETPAMEIVDLNLLIDEVLSDVSHWYPRVETACQKGQLPKMRTYSATLHRVLRNLVSNAFKYHAGNSLRIQVEAVLEDGEGRLVLTDNGRGISADDLSRIFEYGYAGPEAHFRRPGSGRGLSLTRQLLRAIGGDIEVDSNPDKGTQVTVSFPAEPVD